MSISIIKYYTVFRPQSHFGKLSFTLYSTDTADNGEIQKAAISPKCEKNIKSINNSTKYLVVSDIILNTHTHTHRLNVSPPPSTSVEKGTNINFFSFPQTKSQKKSQLLPVFSIFDPESAVSGIQITAALSCQIPRAKYTFRDGGVFLFFPIHIYNIKYNY